MVPAAFSLIGILIGLQGIDGSQECSWDPQEAALQCSLSWHQDQARLTFAKHQREATSVLKIICQDHGKKGQKKRLLVDYKNRRNEKNFWPHLQSVEVENCPLSLIGVVLDGLSLETKGDDILRDVIKPILGGRSLSGLRHLTLTKSHQEDVNDFSSDLWCEVGSNLISLNLSSNGLNKVPVSLNGSCPHFSLQRVEKINLAGNFISQLTDGPASILELSSGSLTHLDLSNNRLQSLTPFKSRRLKFVDVSENKLTSWSSLLAFVAASAPSLQELQAQGNQMANLSTSEPVIAFDNLVVLNLSRNALSTIEGLQRLQLKFLVALDFSHNRLKSLPDLSDLSGSLQVLSLSHNQLVSLGSLTSLTRLHVLMLSHNNLDEKGLTSHPMANMSDLRSLSLDHNRLKGLPR